MNNITLMGHGIFLVISRRPIFLYICNEYKIAHQQASFHETLNYKSL